MLEHLRRLIVHLYPRTWRDRYGEEFSALLDDAPARWRDLPDLTRGALAMQLQARSWKHVAALGGLIGLIAAATLMLTQPPQFASVAKIRTSDGKAIPFLSMHVLSRPVLAEILVRNRLYMDHVPIREPLEDLVERMRINIHIDQDPKNPSEFGVVFRYPDAQTAQSVVRMLIAEYIFENKRESMAANMPGSILEEVSAPDLSTHPLRSISTWTLLWGIALGALAALIIRQPIRRTFRLAAFALAGLIVVGAPLYLVKDRFLSTATIVARRAITVPRQSNVQIQELPMPAASPHVYRVTAIRTNRLEAQRALQGLLVALDPAIKEIVESPSVPALPISPNRIIPPLWGAAAALLYGILRTRRYIYSGTAIPNTPNANSN
ncbi:MAG TPA: hypothetical protein VGL53_02955 [Bryobacteraceae bacterium]|jgi:hypothetical protein